MGVSVKAKVTLETLRNGCKQLAIPFKPNNSAKQLEQKIVLELQRCKTFGSYACGGCQRDIINGLPMCPFCSVRFRHALLEDTEDTLTGDLDKDLQTANQALEAEEESAKKASRDLDNPPKRRRRRKKPSSDNVESVVEEAPKRKRRKKKSKAADQVRSRQKEKDLQAKRDQIKQELPYSKNDLLLMKRKALIMVARVLDIPNPLKLGSNSKIVTAILDAQKEQFDA